MPFYYTPWIILPLFSALANGALALYAWPRRHTPAAIWFFWLMVGMSGWSLFYALNTIATDLHLKKLFFIAAHCLFCITLFVTLPMTLVVTGKVERFSRLWLSLFAIVPLVSIFMGLTNDLHGLLRADMHIVTKAGIVLMGFTHGRFFTSFQNQYNSLYFLLIILLCVWGILKRGQTRRNSLVFILAATLIPLITDLLNLAPVQEFRLTTSALFLSGLCYWRAVFNHQLLNLVPIAQSTLFRQMQESVLIVDNEGRLADFNLAAEKLLALPVEALGRSFDMLYPPNHPLHGLLPTVSETIQHDSESGRWWQISQTQLHHGKSDIGRVLVLHDVTSIKHTQEELCISEERFRRLSEDSADMVWELDTDMCFTYVNASDKAMRGFQPEEVLGRPITMFLKEQDTATIKTANAERLRQEQFGIRTNSVRYEVQMLCKDGSYLWTEVISNPLRDADGRITGYIGVTRDISTRMAEQQRQQVLLEFERELRKEHESFLAMISHEYRTPLAIIQTNLGLIELKEADSERLYAPQIATMKQAIRRLADILDVSLKQMSANSASVDSAKERITLVSFIDEVIDKAETFWPDRMFVYQPELTSEAVMGNPIQLTTTVLNLLDNACKYSLEGTPILISDHADGTTATVTVTNQGAAILADEVDLLFEKFQRGSNSNGTSGAGIGLWLAQRVAKQHGGSISIEPSSKGDTHITLRLPILE